MAISHHIGDIVVQLDTMNCHLDTTPLSSFPSLPSSLLFYVSLCLPSCCQARSTSTMVVLGSASRCSHKNSCQQQINVVSEVPLATPLTLCRPLFPWWRRLSPLSHEAIYAFSRSRHVCCHGQGVKDLQARPDHRGCFCLSQHAKVNQQESPDPPPPATNWARG